MIDQDTIFLLDGAGQLQKIRHCRYESEDLLQGLIDQYPELMVGEQIDPDDPPRWLMVQREAGIPDIEGGYDRWSIDHVLLDQHGRPTLVEVKRSTDTRIRREVVGQMMDYAANALKYWPVDRIREFAASQNGGAEALEARVNDLLDEEGGDIEGFWNTVETNLREGRLRLLFVSDQIPTELRRIIEFLNEQMSRSEVLGVEIRQYERNGTRILVPRVVGQTETARQAKSTGRKKPKVERNQFLAMCDLKSTEFFESLFDEIENRRLEVNWGTTGFSVRWPSASGRKVTLGYGVVPNYYNSGQKEPIFEVFLGQLPEEENTDWLRAELMRTGYYSQHGEHTYHLSLERAPTKQARRVLAPVFEFGEQLNKPKSSG